MQLQQPFAVITPSVDGDVLHVLASAHAAFTAPELHSLIVRRSLSGVRLALARLSEQGVVETTVVGKTRQYALNDEHLLAPSIRSIADTKATFITRLRRLLTAWEIQPSYAALFGSAARGEMRPDSDIDVLLVRRHNSADARWDAQVSDLTLAATALTGNDTRVIDLTPADLGSESHRGLLEAIVADAITLIGDRTRLTSAAARTIP